MSEQDRERGKARRTEVMGEAFVERAMRDLDGFSRPLQNWLNEHAWGSTWQRGGIDLKTRSLCTCAMLAALGRGTELKGHVRGAINNGASPVEIREVLLRGVRGRAGGGRSVPQRARGLRGTGPERARRRGLNAAPRTRRAAANRPRARLRGTATTWRLPP